MEQNRNLVKASRGAMFGKIKNPADFKNFMDQWEHYYESPKQITRRFIWH